MKKTITSISIFAMFSLAGCGDSSPGDIVKDVESSARVACEVQKITKEKIPPMQKFAKLAALKSEIEGLKAAKSRIKKYSETLDKSEKEKVRPEIAKLMADAMKEAGC